MPSSACKTCALDRKSTRLNSSHTIISYAVFCLKTKQATTALATDERLDCGFLRAHAAVAAVSALGAFAGRRAPGAGLFPSSFFFLFFFNDTPPTEIYPLPPHAPFRF